jgi:hypothetical protein
VTSSAASCDCLLPFRFAVLCLALALDEVNQVPRDFDPFAAKADTISLVLAFGFAASISRIAWDLFTPFRFAITISR